MSRPFIATVLCAALLCAGPASAQFQKPEDAIKYRQSAMAIQNVHLARLFAMANGRVPFDARAAGENIELIAAINRIQFAGFVEGGDKALTRAKPEIWTEKEKWGAAAARSQDDVDRLVAAGKSGQLDQIRTAVGAVGQSCKACHDSYRADR